MKTSPLAALYTVTVAPPPLAPLDVGSPLLPGAGTAMRCSAVSPLVIDSKEKRRLLGFPDTEPSRSLSAVAGTVTGWPGRYHMGEVQARSWIVRSNPPVAGSFDAHPGTSVCQSVGLLAFTRSQS